MKVHFIAVGGSAMHNLAIALKLKGFTVTGSDDEIFDPAKGRLDKYGILPPETGWHPERITTDLDAVVVGMHARTDNPELLKAKEMGLRIYSYPEYLYEQSKNKTRVVVGGSHGKTTITAMIIHVLQANHIDCDYMVGAQLEGFEVMVRLSDTAKVMVIEGDEYLTSPIDRRPKFHVYRPTIGIVSGIAWDHVNVFPTFEDYVSQFEIFARMIPSDGQFIYCADDEELQKIAPKITQTARRPYSVHPHRIVNGVTYLLTDKKEYPLRIFGRHNMANLNAARLACTALGVTDDGFYEAMTTFNGASNRLQLLAGNGQTAIYKDFAHSPSKLEATISAVREQYPDRLLVACMELHTYSSLTAGFLQQYRHTMRQADVAAVFFSPHAVELKKLPPMTPEAVYEAFGRRDLKVFNDTGRLLDFLYGRDWRGSVLLMMSSGNFGGINFSALSEKIVHLPPSKKDGTDS